MLRVYLDQNKWIDLARAAKGTPQGAPFRDVLDVATAAAEAGLASFPLDVSRYMETAKRGSYESRLELATVMLRLSRLDTIAPPSVILPAEIDAALRRRCGRPETPRPLRVFERGIDHALGGRLEESRIELPEGLTVPPGYLAQVNETLRLVLETVALTGPPPGMTLPPGYAEVIAAMTQDREYAAHENDLAALMAEHGHNKGDRLDRAVLGTELRDISRPVVEALVRADIDPQSFVDVLGREGLASFLDDLPSRAVTTSMRRRKHAETQQRWEQNDLNDVVSLPVAAAYCDVVVTERQWTSRMRQAKVDTRYGTVLLADLRELTDVLVATSAS